MARMDTVLRLAQGAEVNIVKQVLRLHCMARSAVLWLVIRMASEVMVIQEAEAVVDWHRHLDNLNKHSPQFIVAWPFVIQLLCNRVR